MDTNTVDNFNQVLIEALDESFLNLGKKVKDVVYTILEKTYKIKKKQIPQNVLSFSIALNQMFGHAAVPLEILLRKKLEAKVERCQWLENKDIPCQWLITEEKITSMVQLFWADKVAASNIANDTVELLNKIVQKDPGFFKGKCVNSAIGSLFYILGTHYNAPIKQRELADKLTTTDVSIRASYKQLLETFPDLFIN